MRMQAAVLLVLCYLALTGAMFFDLGEQEEKCIIEEVPEDTLVTGYFLLEYWDAKKPNNSPHLGLTVHVRDPDHQTLMSKRYGRKGKFTFTAHSPGQHFLCMKSNSTRFAVFAGDRLFSDFRLILAVMMPNWILCNSCFHPPSEDLRLAVTTCGHIVCQKCFQKGKQGECLICKSQCQVSPLSEKSRPEVQDLFSDINIVANRYLSETTKVLIFQMRHQRRLLSHYRERNIKLEEVLNQMKQEMVQMRREMEVQSAHTVQLVTPRKQQSVRAAQQCSRVSPSSVAPLKQILFASPMALSQQASTSSLVDQMDVDGQGLYRKPEVYGSRSRISLISPLRPDGWESSERNDLFDAKRSGLDST
ncbi:hypothetical protein AAFF_G00157650 [Aldrovandia affinis]|uniref:RING-type domain-containing protein n=1 Tax=Aldrovandia affinis TaxID=143900 RepID=A0AAD7W8I1_9TELE|nr:hypothetical protein AAFF_G00157650 [Aldrovandia affinis]